MSGLRVRCPSCRRDVPWETWDTHAPACLPARVVSPAVEAIGGAGSLLVAVVAVASIVVMVAIPLALLLAWWLT